MKFKDYFSNTATNEFEKKEVEISNDIYSLAFFTIGNILNKQQDICVMRILKNSTLFLFYLLFFGCYTVPETGRSAFTLLPEDTLINQSKLAFIQLKKEGQVSNNYE